MFLAELRKRFSAAGQAYIGASSPMTDSMERITLDPAIRGGKPVIRGTRITVTDVLEYLAGGMTPEEVLADFPDLTTDDIRAVLAFAAQRPT